MCEYKTETATSENPYPLGEPKGKDPVEKDSDLKHVSRIAALVCRICDVISESKLYNLTTDQEIKTAIKIVTDKAL